MKNDFVMTEFIASMLPALEWAAKYAGVLALGGVLVAIWQYKATLKIASDNARRDAIKLAAEQSANFGLEILRDFSTLRAEIEKESAFFSKCVFDSKEERIDVKWDTAEDADLAALLKRSSEIALVLNKLEAFSIFFATNVADDHVGYVECAPAFIELFEKNLPLYGNHDMKVFYQATQTIYWRWKQRAKQQHLLKEAEAWKNKGIEIMRGLDPRHLASKKPIGS